MRTHEVRSIEIAAPHEVVFTFIAEPDNLPRWTHAFESVNGSHARMRTPAGAVDVQLEVLTSREHGTIDWIMTFPDGTTAEAYSRVTRGIDSRVIYSFVLNAPRVPLEQLEGTLSRQVETLESELAQLKASIENHDPSK